MVTGVNKDIFKRFQKGMINKFLSLDIKQRPFEEQEIILETYIEVATNLLEEIKLQKEMGLCK